MNTAEQINEKSTGNTDASMNALTGLIVKCSREILKENLMDVYLNGSAVMG